MSTELCGIPLTDFSDPIHVALTGYNERAAGRYTFDLNNAPRLGFVTGKPTARSQTDILTHTGDKVAELFVIAFAPEDGTGDDKTYTADQLDMGGFPADPKYFPRNKRTAHSEAHLTIVSKDLETPTDPVLFAGHLSVLGIVGANRVAEVGFVGQDLQDFVESMPIGGDTPDEPAHPTATLTTGYKRGLVTPEHPGDRFGDPHAILNRAESVIQIAGFVAISPEMAPEHLELLRLLGAREFRPY